MREPAPDRTALRAPPAGRKPAVPAETDRAALRAIVRDVNARLGEQLRLRRHLAGLSQIEAGAAVGVSGQQWQKYEHGTNRPCAAVLLLAIAELQLDPAELVERCLAGDEPRPRPLRQLDQRLLDRMAELGRDQQRALARFLATVRPDPAPAFPKEGIAL
jgi:transcriptional regulator with XRE-family HTH domain